MSQRIVLAGMNAYFMGKSFDNKQNRHWKYGWQRAKQLKEEHDIISQAAQNAAKRRIN